MQNLNSKFQITETDQPKCLLSITALHEGEPLDHVELT